MPESAAARNVREILLILTARHPHGMGLGVNGVAPEIRLKERFLRDGARVEADYELAVQSVVEQGWVERVSDRVRLTEEGHKIISK